MKCFWAYARFNKNFNKTSKNKCQTNPKEERNISVNPGSPRPCFFLGLGDPSSGTSFTWVVPKSLDF